MEIVVKKGQSIFDIAINATGNILNAFYIAEHNDLDIDDLIDAGDVIEIPDGLVNDDSVLKYYMENNIESGTLETVSGGIGEMGIEMDFIIN